MCAAKNHPQNNNQNNEVSSSFYQNIPPSLWQDWKWQVKNRISDVETLKQIIHLTKEEEQGIRRTLRTLKMAITPYYASLMDANNTECPIRRQAVPTSNELDFSLHDLEDPLDEDTDSPVPGITHRYPDRVLFLVTDQCSMYCRHCTRRRFAGSTDKPASIEVLDHAIKYVAENSKIRDVLISGGDGLLISNEILEYVLSNLQQIEHVEIVRIGTRAPVVLPQRVTDDLVKLLQKYHPVWLNTHFNHPKEITESAQSAVKKLADSGIPLGNQSVLLKGVNDCPAIMKKLVHELVKMRVNPYYLYQCDLSMGIEHFRTSVAAGLEIIEHLRGHTSGFAVPTFVVDAPGGGGKIPIMPQYMISQSPDKVILRNYEGVTCAYSEPTDKHRGCGRNNCQACALAEHETTGIGSLMANQNISLEPENLTRRKRGKQEK